ncbi:ATP-grasp domain-containing protein [Patescibacteria group bacterium]
MPVDSPTKLQTLFSKYQAPPLVYLDMIPAHGLGIENFYPRYSLLCLYDTPDTEQLKKDGVNITTLRSKLEQPQKISPRRSDLPLDSQIGAILKKEKPALLMFNISDEAESWCEQNNIPVLLSQRKLRDKFSDKHALDEILGQLDIPNIPGEITTATAEKIFAAQRKFGTFVIQLSKEGAGSSTFFIKKESDIDNFLSERQNEKIKIKQFIVGPSPSVMACATKHGTIHTPVFSQLIGHPALTKRPGQWCGNEYGGQQYPPATVNKIYQYTKSLGEYLFKHGYQGIFGLDFIIDQQTNEPFVIEINSRFVGSTGFFTDLYLSHNLAPLIGYHLLELLDIPYEIDVPKINSWQPQENYSLIILPNNSPHPKFIRNFMASGIYNQDLKFKKPSFSIADLQNNSLLIKDCLPAKSLWPPSKPMLRIYRRGKLFTDDKKTALPWVEKIASAAYDKLNLRSN